MRNINRFFPLLFTRIASKFDSRILPSRLILGLTLVAVLLSWGCPKQDPLQAFNSPATPIDPGPAPVPEPATALLFGTVLLIGGAIARRRRNRGQ
jgi:hypothetical protein